jgi:anti-sigma B factor antagonist
VEQFTAHPTLQNTAVISLQNQVIGGADALEFSALIHYLCQEGFTTVVVDMSGVELINSSGIGMIVSGHSTMRRNGGRLFLAAVPEKAMKLLKMTHLDKVLDIAPAIDQIAL